MADLARRYNAAVVQYLQAHAAGPELLPSVLVQACLEVLPIDGAGLSLTEELRVPLAASGYAAALAERLQTTLGEGPCLNAAARAEPEAFDLDTMAQRWPLYHAEFVSRTPFRSVASIPVASLSQRRFGALDLYSTQPDGPRVPLDQIVVVATQISIMLFEAPPMTLDHGMSIPVWLTGEPVERRMNAWYAVGILMARTELLASDALATLRAYAYSHQTSLDDIAAQLVDRRLLPEAITDLTPSG